MNLRRVRSFFGFVFMLVLVKIEISGQTNSVSPENENFQYLRREEQEKIRGDRNCCSIGFKTGRIAYHKMKRALSILTAGLMASPVAIAQGSAEGLEVAELSRRRMSTLPPRSCRFSAKTASPATTPRTPMPT